MLLGESRTPFLFFTIAFPLAVEAAAVLLAVKLKWFGNVTTIRVTFPEVGIEKLHSGFPGYLLSDFFEYIVFLMGADKKGGGEGFKAFLAGGYRRFQ